MPTGGSVKLTVDSDKTGYVILPNGVLLTTVAGVINATYVGLEGNILYLVPKYTSAVSILNSGVEGQLIYNGAADLDVSGNTLLTSLIADNCTTIVATSCSLTADAIAYILYHANSNVANEVYYLAFPGGANAIQSAVNTRLLDIYSTSYVTVYTNIVTIDGGTIIIDTV